MAPASIPPSPSRPNEKELRKRDVRATLDYLKSDRGKWLKEVHADADKLESQITDAAIKNKCDALWDHWEKKHGELYERLQKSELYDQLLLKLQTRQVDAVVSALEACSDSEAEEARRSARHAAEYTPKIETRIGELERER